MRMSKLHTCATLKVFLAIISLLSLIMLSVFIGCGKLSDDTDRPSSPTGTSGGVPIPVGPQSSLGTYTLSISSDTDSIPADNLNYAVVTAALADTSGRSLANFPVTFTADSIGNLGPSHLSSVSATTDANGEASVRFYGTTSGDCTVQASIDLDTDGANDLYVTTVITLTSSGQPSSAGNYTLTLTVYPDSIPADMATYATVVAKLVDSSGGSVENFTITFISDLGYLENDPQGPSSLSTTVTGVTSANGSSSVYLYGAREGSAVILARVYINDLVGTLQAKAVVLITEGPGVPGPGVPGVDLSVDPVSDIVDLGICGEEEPQEVEFEFTATVWDETGDEVGAGVRVEISGSGLPDGAPEFAYTDSQGVATWTITWKIASAGTYSKTLTAHVTINGVEYTDTVTFTVVATCKEEEEKIELTAQASPESIEVGETSVISVLVTNADGIMVGQTVTFSVDNSSLGYVSPTSAVTDSTGVARATFTATSAGTVTIYISSGTASATVTITITDAAASITPFAPSTTLRRGTASSVSATLTATATVKNTDGKLIEGVAVGFSITSSCSSTITFAPTSGSGTTNVAGLAQFTFTVTATSATPAGTCTYTLNVNAGSATAETTGTITVN